VLSNYQDRQSGLITTKCSESGLKGETTNQNWVPPPRKPSRPQGFTLTLPLTQKRDVKTLHGLALPLPRTCIIHFAAWQKYLLGFCLPMKRKTENLGRVVNLGHGYQLLLVSF